MITLSDAQDAIARGIGSASAYKHQPNIKFIRTIIREDDESAKKGIVLQQNYCITMPVNRQSKIPHIVTKLKNYNVRAVITDIIEHAAASGWTTSELNIKRMERFIDDHYVPEVRCLNECGKKGDAITLRILYRPPAPEGVVMSADPLIILNIHEGDTLVDGSPANKQSGDIIAALYKLEPLSKHTSRPVPIQNRREGDGEDTTIEMK